MAKTKPYKGTRHNPKPFHFYNILAYMLAVYDTRIAIGGLEADDLICQTQYNSKDTIICSRDKDLRICPGWHYSWECGKQASIGPVETDQLGWLTFKELAEVDKKTGEIKYRKEIFGYGKAFFYAQMLVGDSADNIPGLKSYGHAKALELLSECQTEQDYFTIVKDHYKEVMGEQSKEYFLEQANLLWMQMDGPYTIPKFKE